VALPAFAAARRVEAQLLLTAGRAAISRYLLAAANPQQRRAAGEWNRRTDDSCIDPAPHIVCSAKTNRGRGYKAYCMCQIIGPCA